MVDKPQIITGGLHSDERGKISFVNEFKLDEIKRFYSIQPSNTNVVRAWQGHAKERKWFFVIAGSFKVVAAKIDDWENPPLKPVIYEFDLNEQRPEVLYVPGGYVNGFKAVKPNSKVIVFSDQTVEQSVNDDYRFDQNDWFDWGYKNIETL